MCISTFPPILSNNAEGTVSTTVLLNEKKHNFFTLKHLAALSALQHIDKSSLPPGSLPGVLFDFIIKTAVRKGIEQKKIKQLFSLCPEKDSFTLWCRGEIFFTPKDFLSPSLPLKNFKSIDLTGCYIDQLDALVEKIAAETLQLQELSLWDSGHVSYSSCNALMKSCKHLVSLKIELQGFFVSSTVDPFQQENVLKRLQLSLHSLELPFLKNLVEKNTKLHELTIWATSFTACETFSESLASCPAEKRITIFINDSKFHGFHNFERYFMNVERDFLKIELICADTLSAFDDKWLQLDSIGFQIHWANNYASQTPKKSKNFNPKTFKELISLYQHDPIKLRRFLLNGLLGFATPERIKIYLSEFSEIFIQTISLEGLWRFCSSFIFPDLNSSFEQQNPWFKPLVINFFESALKAIKENDKENFEKVELLENFSNSLLSQQAL